MFPRTTHDVRRAAELHACTKPQVFAPGTGWGTPFSLVLTPVCAGIPAPADDFTDRKLDISRHLIRSPATTFFVRVTGDSMNGACIQSGDLLVVDSLCGPSDGRIVIAAVNGDITVKRLRAKDGQICLEAENPAYGSIELGADSDITILGGVTSVIHDL